MVTTAHQNASGIDLNKELSEPASAKYTALENRTTPVTQRQDRACQAVSGGADWVPHVAVAHRRHRHHRPPKGVRDRVEVGADVVHLGEVDCAREEHHTWWNSRSDQVSAAPVRLGPLKDKLKLNQ